MSALRLAFRRACRSPGQTTVTVLTCALGLAITTVVYAVVHAVVFAPLSYPAAEQLVQVQTRHPQQGLAALAPGTFGDLRSGTNAFSALAAQYYYYVNLTGSGEPALLNSAEVTADYFSVFGVAPLHGRTLQPADFAADATPAVVLSHAAWRSHLGGRASAIGQSLLLDGVAHTVVGVMPASFAEPAEVAQLWRPMRAGRDDPQARGSRYWTVYGRLAAGIATDAANQQLAVVARREQQAFPADYDQWMLAVADLRDVLTENVRPALLSLLGAVACVMLIAGANVASLSLVRVAGRRKELAVCSALGSTRWHAVRALVAENLLLAGAGGALGVVLAYWGLDLLLASVPAGSLPRAAEVQIDATVLATAAALTLVLGCAAGAIPAWLMGGPGGVEALREARGSPGPAAQRFRSLLVATEIALAVVLLVSAGLLGRSFVGLLQRDAGVDAKRVLSLTVSLPAARYGDGARCWAYFREAQRGVSALPGVAAAGFTQTSPFRWGIPAAFFPDRDGAQPRPGEYPTAFVDAVDVDYFRAVGIPLRAGRLFTSHDDGRAPARAILSETAARRYFGAVSPIGRSLIVGTSLQGERLEIVGVVGDVRRSGLTTAPPPQVYRAFAQRTPPYATLMVRTAMPPAALAQAVQRELWRVDADIPISDIATLDSYVARSVAQPRLALWLFAIFAALSLLLSGLGVYGLVAYSVTQRTREFGIRSALGACPRQLVATVLGGTLRLALIGTGLGLLGAVAASRLLQHLLYDTRTLDPVILLMAPLVLIGTTTVACWSPARRATRVDPMIALRAE